MLGTLPVGVVGLTFRRSLEAMFDSVAAVAWAWLVMGCVLIGTLWIRKGGRMLGHMRIQDALLIGTAQCVALIPGISRSGSTMMAAMLLGFEGKEAARFSFWLSVPVILGAGLLKMQEGVTMAFQEPYVLAAGFISSAVVGFISMAVLLRILKTGRLYAFGYYGISLGLFVLAHQTWGIIPQAWVGR